MITRTEIDLGENSGANQLIKKNIDSGKRIFVLHGHRIERSIIHTQRQATIFLFNKESGTTPGRSSGECNPYLTTPGVGFSVRPIPWQAYDKVV
jgi:hypothetical protein